MTDDGSQSPKPKPDVTLAGSLEANEHDKEDADQEATKVERHEALEDPLSPMRTSYHSPKNRRRGSSKSNSPSNRNHFGSTHSRRGGRRSHPISSESQLQTASAHNMTTTATTATLSPRLSASSSHTATTTTAAILETPRRKSGVHNGKRSIVMSPEMAQRFHRFEKDGISEDNNSVIPSMFDGNGKQHTEDEKEAAATDRLSPKRASLGKNHLQQVPLSETGRKRSVRASLKNRVEAFSPQAHIVAPKILLSPREVKQLVSNARRSTQYTKLQSVFQERKALHKKTSQKETQRKVLLEVKQPARQLNWDLLRSRFGEPIVYHGAALALDTKIVKGSSGRTNNDPKSMATIEAAKKVPTKTQTTDSLAPVTTTYEKNPTQIQRILDVVDRNFVFSEFRSGGRARTEKSLQALLDAFQVVTMPMNHILWQEGDIQTTPVKQDGHPELQQQAFYIVDQGKVVFHTNGEQTALVGSGECFGEQELLHPASAAATVSIALNSDQQQGFNSKELIETQETSSTGAQLLHLDPNKYRELLQLLSRQADENKREKLLQIDFLKNILENDFRGEGEEDSQTDHPSIVERLISIMTRVEFTHNQVFEDIQEESTFVIVESGQLHVHQSAEASTVDTIIATGEYYGERALMNSLPKRKKSYKIKRQKVMGSLTNTHLEKGVFFKIDRDSMEAILGPQQLQSLKDIDSFVECHPLKNTKINRRSRRKLAKQMTEEKLTKFQPMLKVEKGDTPALYVVREGVVKIDYDDDRESELKEVGELFGMDMLEEESDPKSGKFLRRSCGFSASIASMDFDFSDDEDTERTKRHQDDASIDIGAAIGVLPVDNLDKVLESKSPEFTMEHNIVPKDSGFVASTDSSFQDLSIHEELNLRQKVRQAVADDFSLKDLEKIKLLGEGMFGEVWLVIADVFNTEQVKQEFALKSQRKEDDARGTEALEEIRREIKVMKDLEHPQIVNLVHHFEDEENVYMLLDLVPGGELWERMYQELPDGSFSSGLSSENDVKFYTFVVAETLKFIHSRNYVFRDLKPENILIDASGYPVLVDFGFTKHVPDKTYTFCGTPNYCSPEMILQAGHNRGVDFWALGITIYEMLTGENPFFFDGMDTVSLYDAIFQEEAYPLKEQDWSSEVIELVDKLLEKDPSKRLGMLADGVDDIIGHRWFEALDHNRIRQKQFPAPWLPAKSHDTNELATFMENSMVVSSIDNLPIINLDESGGSTQLNHSFQSFHNSFNEVLDEQTTNAAIKGNDDLHNVAHTNDKSADELATRFFNEDEVEEKNFEKKKKQSSKSLKRSSRISKSPKKGKKKANSTSTSQTLSESTIKPDFKYFLDDDDDDDESNKNRKGYFNPVPNPNRKSTLSDKASSRSRRDLISGKLAGLGIDSSDDEILDF